MARSDLLVALIKAGVAGDNRAFFGTAEAIIAEERAKQHTVLADRLARAIATRDEARLAVDRPKDRSPRSQDYILEVMPRKTLADLMLPQTSRQAVQQLIEEQLRADLLRAHGLEPRHRILLVGRPGTGKTSLVEAMAEAIGVPLFIVRYETIIGSYLGETAVRLKRVFDYARTTPCVLFFDEFDAIGKERGDTHETGEIKRVVTSLLLQIDDLPSYTIIAAATNHSELLDRAVWRRFQIRLSLPMPTQCDIAEYINTYSRIFEESLGYSTKTIAKRLGSVSYAEVEEFCTDLRRCQILSLGERPLKGIVAEQLRVWSEKVGDASNGESHGGTTDTASAGT